MAIARLTGLLVVLAATLPAADPYLFAYFRNNGAEGVFFAGSADGYRWTALNDGKPMIRPQHPGELMRDPYIARGPDGIYHMVWTWDWHTQRIGYATSPDLTTWSPQREIPVMADVPGTLNVWAPEIYWDRSKSVWLVIWSSTVTGRFPETLGSAGNSLNHRIYAMTTPDFRTFSRPEIFFDPGYPVIDATLFERAGRTYMVFKDERSTPLRKFMLLAESPSLRGPWTVVSEPFTEAWSEGPSVLSIGEEVVVYYDHYQKPQGYRAVSSTDLKSWRDVTARTAFPEGARHGCFLKIR